jgi:pimeloyl-ACP methyl ester carboxylesterase
VLLNPDPRVQSKDADDDFRIEVIPIEGSRVQIDSFLTPGDEITVGDTVTMTRTFTNFGNATSFQIQEVLPEDLSNNPRYSVMEFDTNLIEQLSGPTPALIPSLPPGAGAQIQYTFRAIGPGTNRFYSRMGHMVCNNEMFQAFPRLKMLTIKPVIQVTPRKPSLETFTEDSLEDGNSDPDAPLRFSADETALDDAPEFAGRGLIADGVTPVLFRLEIAPEKLDEFEGETTLSFEATVISGEISGTPIQDRLELLKDGEWITNGEVTVSKTKPVAYGALKAILADELQFADNQVEVTVRIDVRDEDGLVLGRIQLAIRRPPIALIHGYNTNGDWGGEFIKELANARTAPFVRIARYGQEETTSLVSDNQASVNTLWPLRNLAPLAERAFNETLSDLRQQWLFIRHDVVAHSQGGLLTRMLCAKTGNNHVPLPFRNEENFFRGRFHRVITIGSPHNGTRLLRYLLTLNQNNENSLPSWVGYGMVESETAQEKFDPWGEQIRELNDPSPNAMWAPDPAAKFHLVRTVILGGASHTTEFWDCPAFWALGINSPAAGQIVVNQGSDGVVDFASMFAMPSGGPAPAYGYDVPADNRISHAFFEVHAQNFGEIFGATSGQVLSPIVARHVIGALDQDPDVPAAERVFSSFQLPPLLDDATRDAIDALARSYDSDPREADLVRRSPLSVKLPGFSPAGSAQAINLRWTPPADMAPTGRVLWVATLFGPNGVTGKGVEVLPPGADIRDVTVRVNAVGLYGDVILEGMYVSTNGTRVNLKPYLVTTLAAGNTTTTNFQVVPRDQTRHPIGTEIPVQAWSTWSTGKIARRYITPQNFTASSSAPHIVDVSDPLSWQAKAVGEATITAVFDGKTNVVNWTVFDPNTSIEPPGRPTLAIEKAGANGFELSWPSTSVGFELQSSEKLGSEADWRGSTEPAVVNGDRSTVQIPTSPTQRFYRLHKP